MLETAEGRERLQTSIVRKMKEKGSIACDAVSIAAEAAGNFGDEYGIMMYDVMLKAANSAGIPIVDNGR
jgi:hypothetical protein